MSLEKILVAGGAGYIGSITAKFLEKNNYPVVVLDDLSTGHREALSENVKFYQGQIGDSQLLDKIFSENKIACVVHFAAKALVGESVTHPLKYYQSNVCETLSMLESMIKNRVDKIVFSSTCATFGNVADGIIHEGLAQNPINPYGRSKLMIENILKDFHSAYGLNSVILRYFNAAGADPEGFLGEDHSPETHLIPNVIACALQDKPLKVFGNDYPTKDGSCIRDYIHVQDLAYAHLLAFKIMNQKSGCFDFNLGSETGHSVFDVIRAVENEMKKNIKLAQEGRRAGDPPVLVANASKAKKELNWTASYGLQDIIKHAVSWTQTHPKGY